MSKQSKPFIKPSPLGMQPPGGVPAVDETLPADSPPFSLANHFLVAMPSMLDPVFGGSVVYLCEHNAEGALGLIINKPTDMTMRMLLERVDLGADLHGEALPEAAAPVLFGGPVQAERGFVLHAPFGEFGSMLKVTDDVALTTSRDVLQEVAKGQAPRRLLVTLGCSGWSAGQLEEEIARNGWLTVAADPRVIFDVPVAERFAEAIKLLGVDPLLLSGEAGHA